MVLGGMPALALRGIAADGEALGAERFLKVRITALSSESTHALDMTEWMLRDLDFAGAPAGVFG